MSNRGIRLASIVAVIAGFAPVAGCGAPSTDDPSTDRPQPAVTVDGDVATVSNPDAPRWGGEGRLIEEASIGAATGDESQLLGAVTSVTASDEHIYVADIQTVDVRVYGMDGRHVRTIGTEGEGPGEFRRPWNVGFTRHGELRVRDQWQRRLHVYTPDGELLGDWPTEGGLDATIGSDGSVYTIRENLFPDEHGVVTVAVRRHDPEGVASDWEAFPDLEPTPALVTSGREIELMAVFLGVGADWRAARWVPFAPRVIAEMTPDGAMISARADRYRFEVRRPDGTVLVVEKEWTPVSVDADEADWYRSRAIAQWRAATDPSWQWAETAEIPDHKGAFAWIVPAHDGGFWVIREIAGEGIRGCDDDPDDYYDYVEQPCWRQPMLADVFDGEGRFLGSVSMPDDILYHVAPYIRDDLVVVVEEDEAGISYVKRYRLEIPG